MTAEIRQGEPMPEEVPQKKDFPVTASAAHYMVGLRNNKELKDLVTSSGLPLTRVSMGGYFYMQSELDALLAWRLSQSTDNPLPPIDNQKKPKPRGGSLAHEVKDRLDGAEQLLPGSTEVNLGTRSRPLPKEERSTQANTIPEGHITREEALKKMQISGLLWYQLVEIPYKKGGRRKYYRESDVEAAVNERFKDNPRRNLKHEGKMNLDQVLEKLGISKQTFNRRVASGEITLTTEMIRGGLFYDPIEVAAIALRPRELLRRRRSASIPEGYVPKERMLAEVGLNAHQWGARSKDYTFSALTIGRVQYFREEDVAVIAADLKRRNEEAEQARQAEINTKQERAAVKIAQRALEQEEERMAREIARQEKKDLAQREREKKDAKKEKERQEAAARRSAQASRRAQSTPQTSQPKGEPTPTKSKKTPSYSFGESKKRMARNKTREIALGECMHHYWIEIQDGVEMGTCKKCGQTRIFNNTPQFTTGKKRKEAVEYRPPSEISDSEVRILDLAFSGISISDIAAQFGYKVESVRSVIAKHIEAKGGDGGVAMGIKGILATGLIEPSFASDLDGELDETHMAYLDAVSKGQEDKFFEAQGEGFNARKLRDELRRKMGLENDIAPIVWAVTRD